MAMPDAPAPMTTAWYPGGGDGTLSRACRSASCSGTNPSTWRNIGPYSDGIGSAIDTDSIRTSSASDGSGNGDGAPSSQASMAASAASRISARRGREAGIVVIVEPTRPVGR